MIPATGWLFKSTPTGFLPSEDQGAIFGEIVLPRRRFGQPHRAPSRKRVEEIAARGAGRRRRDVGHRLHPCSTGRSSRTAALLVLTLKPFDERTDPALSADSLIARARRRCGRCARPTSSSTTCRRSSASAPAAASSTSCRAWAAAVRRRYRRGRARARVRRQPGPGAAARVHAPSRPDTPQLYLDIDRDKVQTLGIEVSDVFNALQAVLGSAYVNDFNLFGRTWQVNVQGEASDRSKIDDIYRINVRNSDGRDGAGARVRAGAADPRAAVDHPLQQLPQRHDQRRSGARLQLGRGARRDGEGLGRDAAAPATASNGPARRCRRRRRPARRRSSSALAVLFAYLFLVGLYESWTIPVAVLLSVTVGVLGAMLALLTVRARQQSLCPDRPRRADRARGEERHPDRRVRQGAPRAGPADRRGGRSRARASASAR